MRMHYTDGPWTFTKYGYEKYSVNGKNGAEVCGTWKEANARLIACAPELLEALEDIYDDVRQGAIPNWNDPWYQKTELLIKKAKGE